MHLGDRIGLDGKSVPSAVCTPTRQGRNGRALSTFRAAVIATVLSLLAVPCPPISKCLSDVITLRIMAMALVSPSSVGKGWSQKKVWSTGTEPGLDWSFSEGKRRSRLCSPFSPKRRTRRHKEGREREEEIANVPQNVESSTVAILATLAWLCSIPKTM